MFHLQNYLNQFTQRVTPNYLIQVVTQLSI